MCEVQQDDGEGEMMTCKVCNGAKYVDVLDVWSIQRAVIEHGQISIDSAEALPLLKQAIRCPECQGEEAAEDDLQELKKRMGGSPWKAETFETPDSSIA